LKLEREKVTKLTEQMSSFKVESAIQTEAVKKGVVDPEAALKLVDRSGIKVDESGSAIGVAEAIQALVANKPYLVDVKKANLGGGVPANQNPAKIKLSEAQNMDYYNKHRAEVDEAYATGNIEIDVPVGGNITPQTPTT